MDIIREVESVVVGPSVLRLTIRRKGQFGTEQLKFETKPDETVQDLMIGAAEATRDLEVLDMQLSRKTQVQIKEEQALVDQVLAVI